MTTRTQAKTQAKTSAAPVATHILQPSIAVPEREVERPDVAALMESAARLGHSLEAISVDGAAPPIVQRQELPEEEEEELQMQREPAALQRQELPEEEEEEGLQMKPNLSRVGLDGGLVPPDVEAAIGRARGGGQQLDGRIQAQMGATLGHDFSGVRVHTDAEADALNQQLGARVFTTGRDIFFGRGEHNPAGSRGRELLAHELSHVVQQSSGRVTGSGGGMAVRPAGDAFEQEADRVADAANSTAVGASMQRHLPEEDGVQGMPVLQRQPEAEQMQLLEDRGELFVEALLNLFGGADVEDLVSAAWGYVRQGILAMWGGDRGLGSEFFEAAARHLAPLLPQPEQMGDGAIALWSGSIEATAIKAREYAERQGFTTLETTEVGRVLEMLQLGDVIGYWPDTLPLWIAISRQYASLPKSGEVHVFAAARHNITQLLNRPPEEQPVLISTELAELQEKHDQLVRIGGAGITPVWHVLGFDENMEIRPVDINGNFDDLATHRTLAAAGEAMEMYITLRSPA